VDRVSGRDGLARLMGRLAPVPIRGWRIFRQSRRKTRQGLPFLRRDLRWNPIEVAESVRESSRCTAGALFAISTHGAILWIASEPKRVYFNKGR
jgi:hypothetical protein